VAVRRGDVELGMPGWIQRLRLVKSRSRWMPLFPMKSAEPSFPLTLVESGRFQADGH
jgi:hypothetical protein